MAPDSEGGVAAAGIAKGLGSPNESNAAFNSKLMLAGSKGSSGNSIT